MRPQSLARVPAGRAIAAIYSATSWRIARWSATATHGPAKTDADRSSVHSSEVKSVLSVIAVMSSYLPDTVIRRGWALSSLGARSVRTPSFSSALISSASASPGSEKLVVELADLAGLPAQDALAFALLDFAVHPDLIAGYLNREAVVRHAG
jgi:hypothetical protein